MQLGLELDGLILYDCATYVGTDLMRKSVSLAFTIGLAAAGIGQAEPISVSSKSQSGLSKAQLKVLDTRAASQYANSVRLQPPRAIIPGTPAALAAAGKYDGPYLIVARKAAAHHQIPEDLFLRLVRQESGWNENARSEKGAIGLAQLMPGTAKQLRVDPTDPEENLYGGAKYLRQMFDKFGSWRLALAAYNAGPEAVTKYRGIPPYDETQNYVRAILGS